MDELHNIHDQLLPLACPIEDLKLDPENARNHNTRSIEAVAASLKEHGQRKPIIAQKSTRVVKAGNGTLRAAKRLGWTHIAVVVADDDDLQAARFALQDNRTAELSSWDDAQLAQTLQDIHEQMDVTGLGWDEAELKSYLEDFEQPKEEFPAKGASIPHDPRDDELPEEVEAFTKPGDQHMVGSHTVMCADCLDVMRELEDSSVDAIVTDPPYGIGFMGKEWDVSVPGPEWAAECLRVLRPGGHLVAFGATRTVWKLFAILDGAGFEIRDMISWLQWQGFPKNHDVGKGWGTALKPAQEPAVLARKPVERRTVKANVKHHGTGALNIDGCRYAYGDAAWPGPQKDPGSMDASFAPNERYGKLDYNAGQQWDSDPRGRWPANVYACPKPARSEREEGADGLRAESKAQLAGAKGSSTDPVSERFRSKPMANIHPTVKPVRLMRWLVRLVTPPGGLVLEPFLGSGTTALAAEREGFSCLGIEAEPRYCDIALARLKHAVNA